MHARLADKPSVKLISPALQVELDWFIPLCLFELNKGTGFKRAAAKVLSYQIHYYPYMAAGGTHCAATKTIWYKIDRLSILMHEVAHALQYRTGVYQTPSSSFSWRMRFEQECQSAALYMLGILYPGEKLTRAERTTYFDVYSLKWLMEYYAAEIPIDIEFPIDKDNFKLSQVTILTT